MSRSIDELSEWVSAAKAGNKRAFEQVYILTHRKLYLYCLRLLAKPEVAEEILQESYVKAWLALKDFRNEGGFYSWIRQIASRLMIDHFRLKESRVWQNITDLDVELPAASSSVEQAIDMENQIRRLPQGARLVLVMHDLEGFAHKEIAQLTGIAEGTSKAQLSRARQLLRNALTSNHRNQTQDNEDREES
ncbi:RNA polymerase sigma factor [Aliikangiella maris]|uniref:RNA polymerase sigma factor n=2 Tax=Aliikangiella maris TaxID=3162458 RepID=A0ABV3MPA0_9GAMM